VSPSPATSGSPCRFHSSEKTRLPVLSLHQPWEQSWRFFHCYFVETDLMSYTESPDCPVTQIKNQSPHNAFRALHHLCPLLSCHPPSRGHQPHQPSGPSRSPEDLQAESSSWHSFFELMSSEAHRSNPHPLWSLFLVSLFLEVLDFELRLARQALNCLSHTFNCFSCGYFWDRISHFLPRAAWTVCHFTFPTSVEMTGMRDHTQLFVEMGSPELFAQNGLEPQSSRSQPPK
jgi:hypothetical protein